MTDIKIGQSVKRHEDLRFLTGKGRYIDDISFEDQAYGVFVRSPHAHADIVSVDTAEAAAMPGVLLIVTGKDWQKAGYGTFTSKSQARTNRDGSDFRDPPRPCLAHGRVRYLGEPVALVVAETQAQAVEAAEAVMVDYDERPAVIDPVAALKPDAPRVWDDIPSNVSLDYELGDAAATDAALKAADHVVTVEVVNNRVSAVPLEPRCCVGLYDAVNDSFTLWNGSQNIHANRDAFAAEVLGIDPARLHHVAPDIGGGFGAKNSTYGEPPVILHAARELRRPVKWVNSRSESFLTDTHGRGQVSTVHLGLSRDGLIQALKVETVGNIGAYAWTTGPFTPSGGSARTQGGPYNIPTACYQAKAVFTNTMALDPYRGAGRPEASFHIERAVEEAARTLGMEPVELRRKNLLTPDMLPHTSPMGLDIDSGDFPHIFEKTLEMSGYSRVAEARDKARARGRLFGYAASPYLECTGGKPQEYASLTFDADGRATLAVGSQSTGMGHETAMVQLVAAELGLDFDAIGYVQADTAATPIGGGHGGSRGMEVGGNAVLQAARAVVEKGKPIAAHLLQADEDAVSFADGVYSAGAGSVAMRDVIAASLDPARLPDGMATGALDEAATFDRASISVPNGVHAATVEIDPETGVIEVTGYWAIDDFGTIINPMLADGQVMGGIVQGIGQALIEEIRYDPASGQLLTGSLMDYGMPRADMIPDFEIDYFEGAPTKKNPLGVKGAGEAGCVGACPVIVNAVLDALRPVGVRKIDMPMTPQKVWQAIRDAADA